MKVLFVCCGNSKNFDIAPFIKTQGDSLCKRGIELSYFTINERGLFGYIRYSLKLNKYLKNNDVDIIHSHYTLSGWTSVLAFSGKKMVLSLMGSDAYGDFIGENKRTCKSRFSTLLTYLIQPFVDKIICKSEHIGSFVLNKKKAIIIPNGVMLEKVYYNPKGFRKELGMDENRKYLLFLGNKDDKRKNWTLVERALAIINDPDYEIIAPYPIDYGKTIKYMNSVDVVVVTSFMEGSPNVVKEAMACNCPVVATKVGDIEWLFGDEPGYFLTSFDEKDCADQIIKAVQYSSEVGKTKGRERIIQLGLDDETVAERIEKVYKSLM